MPTIEYEHEGKTYELVPQNVNEKNCCAGCELPQCQKTNGFNECTANENLKKVWKIKACRPKSANI